LDQNRPLCQNGGRRLAGHGQRLGERNRDGNTGIFPWCFTPELYVARPDYVESLAAFVRGRPAQPVDAFMRQANAVIAHDVEPHLSKITAPAQVTCGRYDMITDLRFAERMEAKIRRAEPIVFEGCAHAPIYEKVDEFNQRTIEFLKQHSG
jgi:pimeloyl-ACP methyl ester carboxylesterase